MSNQLFPKWKEALLQFTANNNLSSGTVKAALLTAGYTYSSTDQFYSAISSAVVGTPQTIGSKTFTNGTFDGSDVTYTAVTGSQVVSIAIYIDTGSSSTSPLVAFINTSVTNLPVTPNGGDITIVWDAAGIFTL